MARVQYSMINGPPIFVLGFYLFIRRTIIIDKISSAIAPMIALHKFPTRTQFALTVCNHTFARTHFDNLYLTSQVHSTCRFFHLIVCVLTPIIYYTARNKVGSKYESEFIEKFCLNMFPFPGTVETPLVFQPNWTITNDRLDHSVRS